MEAIMTNEWKQTIRYIFLGIALFGICQALSAFWKMFNSIYYIDNAVFQLILKILTALFAPQFTSGILLIVFGFILWHCWRKV